MGKAIFRSSVILFIILSLTGCRQSLFEGSAWQRTAEGFQFPEGPAWSDNGTLYVSNCNSNWIAEISGDAVDTLLTASDSTFGKTNGMLVTSDGDILACDFGFGAILEISPDGQVTTLISGYQGEKFNRPNDLTIYNEELLYFTDPKSYGKDKLDGRLFLYNSGSDSLTLVDDGLAFPNGIGVSPKDGKLYVCESAKNHIVRYDIGNDGLLSGREIFVTLPGGDPDGIEFDVQGNLYVAHFGTGTVFVISPEGQIIENIKTPGQKPSNLEFGGSDRKTLYLTEDETNAVYQIRVRNRGA